jgi:hypothetical protein
MFVTCKTRNGDLYQALLKVEDAEKPHFRLHTIMDGSVHDIDQ